MLGTPEAFRTGMEGEGSLPTQACGPETPAREKGFCGEARKLVQETGQKKWPTREK